MRYIRYNNNNNIEHGILLTDNSIQPITQLPYGDNTLNIIKDGPTILLEDVGLLAPCQPGKIVATAINYPGATGLTEKVDEPLVFIKPSNSVIGPNQTIVSPFKDVPVWGEPELAIVIGKRLSKATTVEASNAIFGYTIGNDVSCENVHGWDHHLARSKGADTFCVLGPWIDTEYKLDNQQIRGYHNNTLIRSGYCKQRIWKEPELLVWLSSWMTLEPGDVVLTGAPSRVRDRMYFEDKDIFTCEIEGLGRLLNPFELKV